MTKEKEKKSYVDGSTGNGGEGGYCLAFLRVVNVNSNISVALYRRNYRPEEWYQKNNKNGSSHRHLTLQRECDETVTSNVFPDRKKAKKQKTKTIQILEKMSDVDKKTRVPTRQIMKSATKETA